MRGSTLWSLSLQQLQRGRGQGSKSDVVPTELLEFSGAACPHQLFCEGPEHIETHRNTVSCEAAVVPQAVPDEAGPIEVEGDEEEYSPKTPKRQNEVERVEVPAKTRKAGSDAEPMNADLLMYMKHMFESNCEQMRKVGAHIARHEEQMEKCSRNFADLNERVGNLELACGEDSGAVKYQFEELEKRVKAAMKKEVSAVQQTRLPQMLGQCRRQ